MILSPSELTSVFDVNRMQKLTNQRSRMSSFGDLTNQRRVRGSPRSSLFRGLSAKLVSGYIKKKKSLEEAISNMEGVTDSLESASLLEMMIESQGEEWMEGSPYSDFMARQAPDANSADGLTLPLDYTLSAIQLKEFIIAASKDALIEAGVEDLPTSLNKPTDGIKPEDLKNWKKVMKSYKLYMDESCVKRDAFFYINGRLFEKGMTTGRVCAFIFGCTTMVLIAMPLGKVDDLMDWIDEFIHAHLKTESIPATHDYWRFTLLAIAYISVCVGAYMSS